MTSLPGQTRRSGFARIASCYIWLLLMFSGLATGCTVFGTDGRQATPAPGVATAPAAARNSGGDPSALPTLSPQTLSTLTAVLSPTPTPSLFASPAPSVDSISLSLDLLAPTEGAGLEVGAVRVLGVTSPTATVTVNGIEAVVDSDGTFQQDLILQEGINSIEALATQPSGGVASDHVVVLFVPPPSGIPLSVLFPQGVEVSEPEITIIGATRQDAVVGVNGMPVDVNSLGIFSTEVSLELGANLIEVVAVDLEENVNFQAVVVFYIP